MSEREFTDEEKMEALERLSRYEEFCKIGRVRRCLESVYTRGVYRVCLFIRWNTM